VSRSRDRQIEIIKQQLLRRSTPRLQISLLLLITGFAGFLTSFFLLHLGVIRMWVRYPVVILISYVVFLLLLRIWLWFRGRSLVLDVDPPSLNLSFPDDLTCGEGVGFSGGDAGGGGAGGSWGDGISSSSSVSSSDTSSSTRFDPGLDLEEGCLIVIAVIALIGGFVACFYVIYVAPALLAEILVDGVLVAGLYRRVRKIEQRHWLLAAATHFSTRRLSRYVFRGRRVGVTKSCSRGTYNRTGLEPYDASGAFSLARENSLADEH
jgi:uncharacterized membrane protein YfcA